MNKLLLMVLMGVFIGLLVGIVMFVRYMGILTVMAIAFIIMLVIFTINLYKHARGSKWDG